jgi:hypothetical protein
MPSALAVFAAAALLPASAQAQGSAPAAPKTFHACYVPLIGTVYRIKEPGLPEACFTNRHVAFSWTDGSATGGNASGTSTNTPNTLVQRDGSGGFAASALTLSGKVDQTSSDGFVARGTLNSGAIPATGAGERLMWYPGKAAFRAGLVQGAEWDDANIGLLSNALGERTIASGDGSTALGVGTAARGNSSTAMGNGTSAAGRSSTAMGNLTMASGHFSTAMGHLASTDGMAGSFVYGDNSAGSIGFVTATAPNQFVVRASGGFRFRTSADLSTGCDLLAGTGSIACTSSRFVKRDFRDVDGEVVLAKLARLPIQSWRYKTEANARHVGPTAQDFRAAFGLGSSETAIATVDADGINLLAAQALGKRTAELRERVRRLEAAVDALTRRCAER